MHPGRHVQRMAPRRAEGSSPFSSGGLRVFKCLLMCGDWSPFPNLGLVSLDKEKGAGRSMPLHKYVQVWL